MYLSFIVICRMGKHYRHANARARSPWPDETRRPYSRNPSFALLCMSVCQNIVLKPSGSMKHEYSGEGRGALFKHLIRGGTCGLPTRAKDRCGRSFGGNFGRLPSFLTCSSHFRRRPEVLRVGAGVVLVSKG